MTILGQFVVLISTTKLQNISPRLLLVRKLEKKNVDFFGLFEVKMTKNFKVVTMVKPLGVELGHDI